MYMILEKREEGMLAGFFEDVTYGMQFDTLKDAVDYANENDLINCIIFKFERFV